MTSRPPRVQLGEAVRGAPGERLLDIRDQNRVVIGQISYRNVDRRRRRAELGIELYPPYRGQGLGTDAIRLLLRILFDRESLDTVYLRVYANNHDARRAYERVGFRYVRTVRWPLIGLVRYLVMEIERQEFSWVPEEPR